MSMVSQTTLPPRPPPLLITLLRPPHRILKVLLSHNTQLDTNRTSPLPENSQQSLRCSPTLVQLCHQLGNIHSGQLVDPSC